jgi:hypothetical protein
VSSWTSHARHEQVTVLWQVAHCVHRRRRLASHIHERSGRAWMNVTRILLVGGAVLALAACGGSTGSTAGR